MGEAGAGLNYPDSPDDVEHIEHSERCCMEGAWPGWGPHPDCPGVCAVEEQGRGLRAGGRQVPGAAMNTDVTMRTCSWCETVHRENLSVPWTHGDYLYFCTDTCFREWGEAG